MEHRWQIHLFGGVRAERNGRVITRFRTQKTAALLGYLAYHSHRAHPRAALIELLWPECPEEVGRHNLSMSLSWLRSQLGTAGDPPGDVLVTDRFLVGLNADALTTDVAEFEAALQSAGDAPDRLAAAVDLYRGPLLAGHFEAWILPEQQRLEERYFQAARALTAALEAAGAVEEAIQYALRAVGVDPLREEAHRELIRLYLAAGRPAVARRQYAELERLLAQELGAAPTEATRALLAQADPRATTGGRRPAQIVAPSPPRSLAPSRPPLEPVGGAVPLDSRFYVTRGADREFQQAIERRDSIVLVKGPRQVGKSSLLARGLQHARESGARVVPTDLEAVNASHLASVETFLLALAEGICDQLELEVAPGDVWEPRRGANPNFRRYLQRHVLGAIEGPIVWGIDEVDRLFGCGYGGEVFSLFRSWHNERALDPSGPWSRLTLALAYATEAHLFITDLSKSPFNVGTRVSLEDFTRAQVADLNARHGAPLRNDAEIDRFFALVGGHPYLVRLGLREMAAHGTPIARFEARAASEEGVFGDHLRRTLLALQRDPALCEVMRALLAGGPGGTPESFFRLRSAGLVSGDSEREMRPRCRLYALYLERRLGERGP